jgi:hypothetical protein
MAEDGSIFFADAFNRTPQQAILTPYAGYWQLAPRLIAEAGAFLPVTSVPLFYALCALLLCSLTFSWFYLPHFRPLVKHDGLRLAFMLLLVLMPALDAPLLIAYSQWPIALWGMLLVLMTPPRNLWVQWLLAFLYLAALATAPVLFVLLPLWIWRFAKAPGRAQRAWIGLIILTTGFLTVATVQALAGTPAETVDWSMIMTDVVRGIAFRLFVSPFLGYTLANGITHVLGWSAIYVLALVVAAVLALAALAPANRAKREIYLVLAYIAASTSALYIFRAPHYQYPFASAVSSAPMHTVRYFFLAISVVYLVCLALLDGAVARRKIPSRAAWAGVSVVLLLYSLDFSLAPWWDPGWAQTAHLLDTIIDPTLKDVITWSSLYPPPTNTAFPNASGEAVEIGVPISPQGWRMVLELPADGPQGYVFPEGPRLLSLATNADGNQLQITAFWQTPLALDYTAYIHLLDKQGVRIGGADVILEPPPLADKPEDVWSTQHTIALPPDVEPGSHDVAVGLYTWRQGKLAPGSAVIVRNLVHIGQPNSY